METQTLSRPAPVVPHALPDNPQRRHPLLWVSITAAFTAVIIHYSSLYGKLAVDPFYDDVAYFVGALVRLHEMYQGGVVALLSGLVHRPPHSFFSDLLAIGSYLVFGTNDWAPYAGNAVIILALAGFLNGLAKGLRLWQRLVLFLFVLTVPICSKAIYEFRPDIASSLCAAMGATIILSRSFLNSTGRQRAAAGALFGLSMLVKTPTFPLTLIVFVTSIGVATASEWAMQEWTPRRKPIDRFYGPWLQCIIPMVLVPFPAYVLQFREILGYIYEPIFGSTKELWRTPGGKLYQLRYYLTGEGGAGMLGEHLYVLGFIILAGFVAAAVFRRRDLIVRLTGFVAVTFVAYAVPTLMSVKQEFFGTTFDWMLLFTALWLLITVCRENDRLVSTLALGATFIAGLASLRFIPELYHPGGENVAARKRIVHQLYSALREQNVGPKARIYITTTGYVNAAVLDYLNLKQGLPMFNIAEQPFSGDLKLHAEQIDEADYVIASEQGNSEAYGGFIPSGNIQDQTLALVRDNGNFEQVAAFPTLTPKRYFLFKRVAPFKGFKAIEGFGPQEGPYPHWGLHEVHWGLGPRTVLSLPYESGGNYVFESTGRPASADLRMTVRLDGQTIGEHQFKNARDFERFDLPLHLAAGHHNLELDYSAWNKTDLKPMAVLFKLLEVTPAAPAQSQPAAPAATQQSRPAEEGQ